jgi:flagellar biogenesis protein FliO
MNHQTNMSQNIKQKNKQFSVPDGYFEYLPNKIMSQINETPASSESKPLFYILKKQLAFAAAFILFFIISYSVFRFISNAIQDNHKTISTNNSTYEDIILAKVEETDLVDFLTNTTEETLNDPNALENYLIDENINEHIIQDNINE